MDVLRVFTSYVLGEFGVASAGRGVVGRALRRAARVACAVVLCAALVDPAAGIAQAVPSALHASVDGSGKIPATGQGAANVHVRLAAVGGEALPPGSAIRATIVSGDARFASGSASADLTAGDGGGVDLPLLPGTKSGPLIVRLDASGATADLELMLTATVRRPLVVGFATGGIGPVPGPIEAPDASNNGTNTRRGTVSLYGNGEVSRNTRLTVAYDSADVLAQSLVAGPWVDNPNDRPFPIYGDGSLRYDDALSLNRVYARLENGRSSAMWGEFSAQAAPATAAGGYNVLVNGANVRAQGNALGAGAFTARNHIAYDRQVISPTGLAIANQVLHPDIVVGSDVLTLVHLNRRTGAIVSQAPLARGSDYVIDYATGLLRFTNIILPYDDAFNPQIVVVQYEYGGPGAKSTMLGGNGSLKLAGDGRFDTWYLNDAIGTGNLTLFGQSLGHTSGTTTWSLSHERSNGFLPITQLQYGQSGDAYRASFASKTDGFALALDYANTAAGYDNPYGNYTAPGLESFAGTARLRMSRISDLELSYLYARNALPSTFGSQAVNNTDAQGEVALRVHPSSRLMYHVGIKNDAASSNGVFNPTFLPSDTAVQAPPSTFFPPMISSIAYQAGEGHSLDADYGLEWRFAPHASVAASRTSPLGGGSFDPYDPPQTQAEVDVDVGTRGKAFLRQLWQRTSSQPLAASQAVQTYAATASSSTSLGFEQQVGAATFQSGYAVDHTVNGTDLFDAIGVRGRVLATPRVTADAFLQVGQQLFSSYGPSFGSALPYFYVGGTSLDYSEKSFHATGRVQLRTGYNAGSTLQLGATGPISPAVSLFGAYTGAFTSGVVDRESRLGLAYRPSRNDRYVTLLSVDSQQTNLLNYNAYVTNVAQVQELYRSSTRTEWAGSVAYKLTGDAFFAPRTSILGLRGDQRIGSRLDLASEVHWSDVAPLNGTRATGFVVEGGYRLGSTLRFAAGYNFSGFTDPSASVNPTHRGTYVTVSSYIDRIFGWGKGDRP